ncbi:MAG: hypothetical protein IAE94_08510 [Chthoniobacterales bacterium]|nr:hypothetical protein [Chthoniobacterales bacterium]
MKIPLPRRKNNPPQSGNSRAFSLVEVTIALGLVSYAILALLGLFTIALSSSRDSMRETTLSQIALHAASIYDGTSATQTNSYSQDGIPLANGSPDQYFQVNLTATPSTITNTSPNLRLLTLAITSPGATNIIQKSSYSGN